MKYIRSIRIKDYAEKWDYDKFRLYLSGIDQVFLTNLCHTEHLILLLLGLELSTTVTGRADFKHLLTIFVKGINIMSNLYDTKAKYIE